ncbi:hypothetical protein QTP86_020744 [Hemibagrus guttatus]|nr:hypothetical protein QTP86_020744 [Hemibagrus guttatus]
MEGVLRLSLRNGISCVPGPCVTVEDVLGEMGKFIGYENLVSASRMNKAVVVFIKKEDLSLWFEGTPFTIYASRGKMKCFECGDLGHKLAACPHKESTSGTTESNESTSNTGPGNNSSNTEDDLFSTCLSSPTPPHCCVPSTGFW